MQSVAAPHAIEIVDYDPQWPVVFAYLSAVLERALDELAQAIEHVGSTAVPGLCAKPIIDFDVVIASRARLPEAVRLLAELGYRHEGDLGISGREAFARPGADVPRDGSGRLWPTHHLYVCAQDNPELHRHLAFRDHLRSDAAAAAAYGELKRRLAQQCAYDRESYWRGKTAFVEAILLPSRAAGQCAQRG
jgi:GrpB-like predicted nucleotidyltransferase (UPF0157 family)